MLVNVQEWGCFSIFWRADDVTQTMSKGGGGCLWNVFTPPPFKKSCIRACYLCKISGKSTPLPPLTKAFPYTPMVLPIYVCAVSDPGGGVHGVRTPPPPFRPQNHVEKGGLWPWAYGDSSVRLRLRGAEGLICPKFYT